jgi:hypothetical protein
VGSWSVGDEIRVQGKLGWLNLDTWFRVVSTAIRPDSPDVANISIVRTEAVIT